VAPGDFVPFLEMKDFEQQPKKNNQRAEGIGNKENNSDGGRDDRLTG
jgi:hypothetical protein